MRGHAFPEDLHNYTPTFWPRLTKFAVITLAWEGRVYRRSDKGVVSQHIQNSLGPLPLPTVWPRVTKFGTVTRGEERVSGGKPWPSSKGDRVPASAKFLGLPTYACMVWPRVTKFGVITRKKECVSGIYQSPNLGGCVAQCIQVCGTSYIFIHSMRNSNQILHSDQTRCEKQIYDIDQNPAVA